MSTTRTKSVITIFGLLIVLAVLSAASLANSQFGGPGQGRPPFTANGTPGPNGGNFQRGNGNGNEGNFQSNNGGRFQGGNGGNFQGRGGGGAFAMFGAVRSLGINPQIFFFVNIGISILGIVLLLLCAYGVWKQKKAALNWAMLLGVLFLLAALPALLFGGMFNVIRLVMGIFTIGAAATIVGMGILPSVRDNFA